MTQLHTGRPKNTVGFLGFFSTGLGNSASQRQQTRLSSGFHWPHFGQSIGVPPSSRGRGDYKGILTQIGALYNYTLSEPVRTVTMNRIDAKSRPAAEIQKRTLMSATLTNSIPSRGPTKDAPNTAT